MSQAERLWSCPGCGTRYWLTDESHWSGGSLICWKCSKLFDASRVPTGNDPLPFGERLNRLFDGE